MPSPHRILLSAFLIATAVSAQTINTIAGNGSAVFSGDGGAATAAGINVPVSVATDPAGNIYIGDQFNDRVRKVNRGGVITTFAGTGIAGFSGDGGPAINAQFNTITGVFVDVNGNVLVADVGNQRIRRIDTTGIVTTVAGSGAQGFGGDGGPATSASFDNCVRAIADPAGNIYIADQSDHRVRRVTASTGIITTIAQAPAPLDFQAMAVPPPVRRSTIPAAWPSIPPETSFSRTTRISACARSRPMAPSTLSRETESLVSRATEQRHFSPS